jgi:hypothetical protein
MTKLEALRLREKLKDGLSKLPQDCLANFRRMYSPKKPNNAAFDIVDEMDTDALLWAARQMENTFEHLEEKEAECKIFADGIQDL